MQQEEIRGIRFWGIYGLTPLLLATAEHLMISYSYFLLLHISFVLLCYTTVYWFTQTCSRMVRL